MRTILKAEDKTIVGEDLGYAIKVYIQERPDLGHTLIGKGVAELEENELLNVGMSLINREVVTDFGTFIVNGDKVMLIGKEDIGYVEMEGGYSKNKLFAMYQNVWKPIIEKEEKKLAREQKKQAKQDYSLFS